MSCSLMLDKTIDYYAELEKDLLKGLSMRVLKDTEEKRKETIYFRQIQNSCQSSSVTCSASAPKYLCQFKLILTATYR